MSELGRTSVARHKRALAVRNKVASAVLADLPKPNRDLEQLWFSLREPPQALRRQADDFERATRTLFLDPPDGLLLPFQISQAIRNGQTTVLSPPAMREVAHRAGLAHAVGQCAERVFSQVDRSSSRRALKQADCLAAITLGDLQRYGEPMRVCTALVERYPEARQAQTDGIKQGCEDMEAMLRNAKRQAGWFSPSRTNTPAQQFLAILKAHVESLHVEWWKTTYEQALTNAKAAIGVAPLRAYAAELDIYLNEQLSRPLMDVYDCSGEPAVADLQERPVATLFDDPHQQAPRSTAEHFDNVIAELYASFRLGPTLRLDYSS